VGATTGALTVYYLSDQLSGRSKYYKISEVAFRKDAKAEITEVKFSPSNERVVLGCRDDCIYLYSCELGTITAGEGRATSTQGTCVLRAMHKLRGHSSTITHIGMPLVLFFTSPRLLIIYVFSAFPRLELRQPAHPVHLRRLRAAVSTHYSVLYLTHCTPSDCSL
jgi:hypothetical protein